MALSGRLAVMAECLLVTQRGHAGPKALDLSSANRARRRRQRDRLTATAGG
jgi:hypothetical protein